MLQVGGRSSDMETVSTTASPHRLAPGTRFRTEPIRNPGGSALIGGVMMLNGDLIGAAVRLADGTIRVEQLEPAAPRPWVVAARRLPFARGMAALASGLSASIAALLWSARVTGSGGPDASGLGSGRASRYAALAFATMVSVAPFWAIHAIVGAVGGGRLTAGVVEGAVRLTFLSGYLWLVGRWGRIADVFGYHGAEHKTIACYEAGDPLVPAVVAGHSRFHPRCGTAFAFWAVMVVTAVGAASGDLGPAVGALVRVGALSVAVGVGYEIVRAGSRAGTTRLGWALRAPGLVLQHLTTREPRLDQIETAIAALRSCATEAQRLAIDMAVADYQHFGPQPFARATEAFSLMSW